MRYSKLIIGILAIVAIAWIGIGFAFQSSYESENNGIEGRYVTINAGGSGSAVLDYVQYYDTVIADSTTLYYLPMTNGTDLIKLNNSPYSVTISDGNTNGTYNLVITSQLPTLFTQSVKNANEWCQFVFKLTKGVNSYYGITTLTELAAGSQYSFYAAEQADNDSTAHADEVASITAGEYTLDLYLKTCEAAGTVGGITGIQVDKTNFVDQFNLANFKIVFTAVGTP